jgi:hypothetical protein
VSAITSILNEEVAMKTVGVRALPGVHRGHYVGTFPTLKCPEMASSHGVALLTWESGLERDLIRLMEWAPFATRLVTQPLRIAYIDGGKTRRYTPDLLVGRDGAPDKLIEVKYAEATESEEFRRWQRLITRACDELGYEFEVWTEREIRVDPRLQNVSYLLRYRWEPVPEDVELEVKRWLREDPGMYLGSVIARLGRPDGHRWAHALMARHAVTYDIDQPLGATTSLFSALH